MQNGDNVYKCKMYDNEHIMNLIKFIQPKTVH